MDGDSLGNRGRLGGWKTSLLALTSLIVWSPRPFRLAPSGGSALSAGRLVPVLPGMSLHPPRPSLRSRGVRVDLLFLTHWPLLKRLEGRQRDLLTDGDPIGECAVTLVLMIRKLIDNYIETHSLLTRNNMLSSVKNSCPLHLVPMTTSHRSAPTAVLVSTEVHQERRSLPGCANPDSDQPFLNSTTQIQSPSHGRDKDWACDSPTEGYMTAG